MTSLIDLQPLFRFYDALLDRTLDDAQTANWRSEDSQRTGFTTITQVLPRETAPFSVYDVGCGPGALHDYLKVHFPSAEYAGCDINPRMIERARRRDPSANVECRNLLESPPSRRYDYVLASGTFNQHGGIPTELWAEFVRDMLRTMYGLANRAMAVTFLSSLVSERDPEDYYPEAAEMLAFAQRDLSPFVEVKHSFSPSHFALIVYRSAQRASSR